MAQEFQYNYSADRQAYLADKLGMSLEELQAALDAGATVHDLAEAAGIEVPLWGDDWMHGLAEDGLAGGIARMAEALGMAVEELEAAVAAEAQFMTSLKQPAWTPHGRRHGRRNEPGRPLGTPVEVFVRAHPDGSSPGWALYFLRRAQCINLPDLLFPLYQGYSGIIEFNRTFQGNLELDKVTAPPCFDH